MHAARFKTREVAELHEQLRSWDHPQYPFIASEYSPASYAPATDFTPYVAAWLAQGREEAIAELWQFLMPDLDSSRYALRKALAARLPSCIHLAEWQQHELRAIHLLAFRAALIHPPGHESYVTRLLAAATLACEPMRVESDALDGFIRATRSEVLDGSPCDVVRGKAGAPAFSVEKAQSDLGLEASAIERLKLVPPMTRLVVHDYVAHGWGQGMLRYCLYYDERMYGCSSKWNQHYVEWLEFFQPPDDSAHVPAAVTKQILCEALSSNGIEYKRSEKRPSLIEKARQKPGLLPSLILQVYPSQQEFRPEWGSPVKEWSHRLRAVEAAASALVKLLGGSVLRYKPSNFSATFSLNEPAK